MPNEPNESLQQSLARLHAELAAAPRIDPASRQQLRELLADIQRTLASTQEDAEGAGQAGGSIPRLEALAIEFEAEHPGLSGSLRQLVDLLGRAGL